MKTLTALFPEGGKNGHLGAHDCLLYEPMFYSGRLTLWPWRKTKRKHFKRDKRAQSGRLWLLRTNFALKVIFLGEDSPMLHQGHCPEDHLSRCAEMWQTRTISRGCAITVHWLLPLLIKSQSVCLFPMLGLFGHPCQLRVEMCPPHSWLLFMFPSGQRQFANLSVIHFAASFAALPCLPPRVCMQIRPKLTPFLNSASLAWGNISFMMAQNQLQSFASSSTDLTFFSVCKKEKRTCSSSYMLIL